MDGENSILLDVTNHEHTCLPLGLGNHICDIDSVQDPLLEDMLSFSLSNKPSECQKIWSILSDSLHYVVVVENIPTCMTYTPSQGYHFKKWKVKHPLYDAAKCNTACRDNNDKYCGIQHCLKTVLTPMLIYLPHICGPRMMQNHSQPKHGLLWVYSHIIVLRDHPVNIIVYT